MLSDSYDLRPSVSGSFSVCWLIPMIRDQVWVVPSLCVGWFLWSETKCEWFLLCVLADSYDLRPSVSGSFSVPCLIPMIWDQVWVVPSFSVCWLIPMIWDQMRGVHSLCVNWLALQLLRSHHVIVKNIPVINLRRPSEVYNGHFYSHNTGYFLWLKALGFSGHFLLTKRLDTHRATQVLHHTCTHK